SGNDRSIGSPDGDSVGIGSAHHNALHDRLPTDNDVFLRFHGSGPPFSGHLPADLRRKTIIPLMVEGKYESARQWSFRSSCRTFSENARLGRPYRSASACP